MSKKIFFGLLVFVLVAFGLSGSTVLSSEDKTVNNGTDTMINISLSELPLGLSGYNVTISLSNASISEITNINYPAWAVLNISSPLPADSVWISAIDLNNMVQNNTNNTVLFTLSVRGDMIGNSSIDLTVNQIDDDFGNLIIPEIHNGSLTVGSRIRYGTISGRVMAG